MKVKDCMTNKVCFCTPEWCVEDVAKEMEKNHIGCMPVCNTKNEVVGLITDRDIVLRSVACGKDMCKTPASEIMTTSVCCCDSEEDVANVEKLMSQMQVKRIPVIENNKVVGMLTLGNLANNKDISEEEVACITENICKCGNNTKNNE